PVHRIARQLGYDDPYYFSRLFRKVIGVAPAEYRKLARG
ncbi:MAG: AraC family transcriptional regulator, partial [Gammaproteobacteria bacterium]